MAEEGEPEKKVSSICIDSVVSKVWCIMKRQKYNGVVFEVGCTVLDFLERFHRCGHFDTIRYGMLNTLYNRLEGCLFGSVKCDIMIGTYDMY